MSSLRLKGSFQLSVSNFYEYFGDSSSTSAKIPADPESSKTETNENRTTANPEPTYEADVFRFPVVSSDEIQELRFEAVNKNTSCFTKQRMNVFRSPCQSHHLENVTIKPMAPEELHKVLSKFYAQLKKNNGDDYEPESLKIMRSAIERYLKEKNY